MATSHHQTSHEIAWNGIRFMAPGDWTPSQMGNHYLMLEHASTPILEIKWRPIKGRFSHDRHLRQLSTRHKKSLGQTVRPWKLPLNWQQALGAFQAEGFQWQGPQISGSGAIVYCPVCGTASLIQFFRSHPAFDDPIALKLLASFQDHAENNEVRWSLFDIRARMPADLKLWRHRFAAGYFELKFASKKHTVMLNRWGPASVLLAGKDLVQFAGSVAAFPASAPPAALAENHQALDWSLSRAVGRWSRWINRIRIRPALQQLRLWHLREKNRILAVQVEGRRPLPTPDFETICKGFSCV